MYKILLGFVFLGVVSCTHLAQTSPQKPSVSWQNTDQPPVFPGCEQEPSTEKQWLCFQQKISKLFVDFFENPITVDLHDMRKDTLWVHLRIDQSGNVILDAVNESDTTSDLFQMLQKAVAQFPKMSPPTKTNLAVTTQVKVRLPIRVP
jgi:hypothetical protein